jgi:uncharacterized protein YbbK (DUF523 family)
MSDDDAPDPEQERQEQVEDPKDFFASQETQLAQFEHRGQTIKVWHYEVTRGMKYEAAEKAALAYMEENPNADEPRTMPSVMERELVRRVVKKWNLPKSPSIGWEMLKDGDLADKILDETGITAAVRSASATDQEVQDAKK